MRRKIAHSPFIRHGVSLTFAAVHGGRYRWKPLLFSPRLMHYGRSTSSSWRRTVSRSPGGRRFLATTKTTPDDANESRFAVEFK
jgi:hypothetical protein